MFVTPMIGVLPPDFYGRPKRYSVSSSNTGSRLSTVSSNASSLYRTSSTASDASTSASSIASVDTKRRPHHRKNSSGSSFTLPRVLQPFHKKVQSTSHPEPERQLPPPPLPPLHQRRQPPLRPRRPSQETLRWSTHVASLPNIRPSTSQWQCLDLVVRCKDDVYNVDRTIMCYHSRWFARICTIMKTTKVSKNVIDLSADDSDAVAALMQYCYQLDYTDKSLDLNPNIDEVPDLNPHVDIYMLAERYGCPGLKKLALQKFEDLATNVLLVNGNEEQLLRAVRAIYQPSRRASADELRRLLIKICADHVQGCISGSQTTIALVFESMDTIPDFRTDLLEEMSSRWK